MKANFKIKENDENSFNEVSINEKDKNITQTEFEEFIIKSGAKGSFMVYRSKNKEHELGLDEL